MNRAEALKIRPRKPPGHAKRRVKGFLWGLVAAPFVAVILYALFAYNSPLNMHLG